MDSVVANIWKYTLILIFNKRVYVPILGAYYLTVPDVGISDIGMILLTSSVAGVIFEVPSGYIADKIGHKQAIITSRLAALISSLLYIYADSLTWFIVAGAFLSISQSFLSGTGNAFMHETLKALGRDHEYTAVMGRVSALGFSIPLLFSTTTPFLTNISFTLPFVVSAILDLVGLIVSLTLRSPEKTSVEIEEIGTTNFRAVLSFAWNNQFLRFATFSGFVGGAAFTFGSFRGAYQILLDIPAMWYGVFFAVGRLSASGLLALSGTIKRHTTRFSFNLMQIIIFGIAFFTLGVTGNPVLIVVAFILINAIQWGFSEVDKGYLLERIPKSQFKATLLSLRSLIDTGIGGISGFLLGYAAEKSSFPEAFFIAASLFIVISGLLLWYTRRVK